MSRKLALFWPPIPRGPSAHGLSGYFNEQIPVPLCGVATFK